MSAREYHAVMVVDTPGRGPVAHSEVVTVQPGQTRADVYEAMLASAIAASGWRPSRFEAGREPVVTFWSLEPDAL